jgi:chemotaxis protein MotB
MARKRRESGGSGHSSNERWLLTYSDLITLLMVFFVVMFAMSSADQKKFNALKSSLQTALKTDGASTSLIMEYSGDRPISKPIPLDQVTDETTEFRDIIQKLQANIADPKKVAVFLDERGLTIRFLDNVLFDLGKGDLRPDSLVLLDAVGVALKNGDHYTRVEGHADNLPINTLQFPSNWELSAARSITVTRYLIQNHGLDPGRLSSLGYGEYHPLYPNTTEENRAKNRRVDIVILRSERAGGEVMEGTKVTK